MNAAERFLADEVEEFLGTELARRLWMDINRSAHEQFIAALRDENSTVTVGRSDVRLDLLPLVAGMALVLRRPAPARP